MSGLSDVNPVQLDAQTLFARLPPNRAGEADRRYLDEVLEDGLGNHESADMLSRFERAFAEKFDMPFAISHNSGSGTMLSCLLAACVGPGDEVIVPTLHHGLHCFRSEFDPGDAVWEVTRTNRLCGGPLEAVHVMLRPLA